MNDESKTKERLIEELVELRRRNAELEGLEATLSRIEKELEETDGFLQSILKSSSSISIISTDLEHNILSWNKGAENIFGYEAEEVVGSHKIDILYPDDRGTKKKVEAIRASAFMDREEVKCEIREVTKDRRELWIGLTVSPRLDENRQVVGVIGIGEDIGERKQAEQRLAEERNLLRTLIDSIPDHIYVKDTESRFVMANAALVRLVGATAMEEVVGKTDFDFFSPEVSAQYRAYEREIMHSGRPVVNKEESDIDQAGNRGWVLTTKVPLRDSNGKVIGLVGINRDITERKRAEEMLAEERERLAVTLRSIGDGVITTDVEGRIVLINEVTEALTGWTEEEAAGRPLTDVFHIVNQDTRERCENPVERVLETDRVVGLANRTILIARDGTERIIADSGAPVRGRDGKTIGVVLVFRDITEKRAAEEELQRMGKLESIGTLAGGIAHDFNNVLTGIMGNISLARMYTDPDKISERLIEAERASMQAQRLTQQLLTFSRGGTPIKKKASIAGLLRDSAIFALRGSNVKCEFCIPDDLWSAEIDEGQIGQVISNMIINARQAMPRGGITKVRAESVTVETEAALPLKEGEYLKISIEDQGIGIPGEDLQSIFDPYFTTKQEGNGLGLATSYSIIKKHDGYITVESQLGVGTAFHIYLPASLGEVLTKKGEVQEKPIMGEGKILVMDDEKHIRDLAAEMLSSIGYGVITTIDGAEAIEIHKEAMESGNPFDVVIMDLTVPGGMGGAETIQRLMEIEPEVKGIVSSGYSNDPILANFGDYGFQGVIAKPYKIMELSEVLHRVITGNR